MSDPVDDYFARDGWWNFEHDEESFLEDELNEVDFECGFLPEDGICLLAGTEDCDFECSYRDAIERKLAT